MRRPALVPFQWWHVPDAMVLEKELFAPDSWTAELFWSELAQGPDRHYLAALPAPQEPLVGYGGLAVYGAEAFVQTLAVATRAQGYGVGGRLLDALLAEAERRHARSVGLEVRAGNTVAQGMYERRGFSVVGRRRGYYQPSGADALVMLRVRAKGPAHP
ncbi:MAG: ribosomal protein S18-alanine N-acetyltransferase [Mycobacteriales bacterium]